jgi:WD40 repeat protein
LQELKGHSDLVRTVVFSPDSKLLASGSYDRTIRLWDVKTGTPCSKLEGHEASIHTVIFSPDGQLLASGSDDGIIRLWDAKTGLPSRKSCAVMVLGSRSPWGYLEKNKSSFRHGPGESESLGVLGEEQK